MLSYLSVSIFLRLPIAIKSLLLGAMGTVYILLIELSHAPVFTCWDTRSMALVSGRGGEGREEDEGVFQENEDDESDEDYENEEDEEDEEDEEYREENEEQEDQGDQEDQKDKKNKDNCKEDEEEDD